MFHTGLMRQLKLSRIRQLHSTFVKNENKSVSETSTKNATTSNSNLSKEELQKIVIGGPLHNVSKIDRLILVAIKRYPNMDAVPKQVTIECIQLAHTKVRIFISFLLMIMAAVGFYLSSRAGKRDVSTGRNIVTERMKWYTAIKEEVEKEAKAAGKT